MKESRNKWKSGQNTAEYVIMLVLIAVGSISLIGVFGKTIRKQFINAIVEMEGQGNKVADDVSSEAVLEDSSMDIDGQR